MTFLNMKIEPQFEMLYIDPFLYLVFINFKEINLECHNRNIFFFNCYNN